MCLSVLKLASGEYATYAFSSKYEKLAVVHPIIILKNLKSGHFMLLICKGQQKNVPRIIIIACSEP